MIVNVYILNIHLLVAMCSPCGKHKELVMRGQHRVAVKCPHCNGKDMGLNPTATSNEKMDIGRHPTEGGPMVLQDLSGRQAV